METLLLQLAVAIVQGIPLLVEEINKSQTLDAEAKKKLLFDLNVAMTEANVKVQAVRFKDTSVPKEVVIVPPAP